MGTGTASPVATAANGDGNQATAATINGPQYIYFDLSNNLLLMDNGNNRLRKVSALDQIITTIAGTGINFSGVDGGFATATSLSDPTGLFVDSVGKIFIAEKSGCKLKMIGSDNKMKTIAGDGSNTLVENVPATTTGIRNMRGVWGNTVGNIFYVDCANQRVRLVSLLSGLVNSIAGNGATYTFIPSGSALSIPLNPLEGMSGDQFGRIYVSDINGATIRGLFVSTQSPTSTPTITMTPTQSPSIAPTVPIYQMFTVAGDGTKGYTPNNVIASAAHVSNPNGNLNSVANSLYYSDSVSQIRNVNFITRINTIFAGTGSNSFSGDGGHNIGCYVFG